MTAPYNAGQTIEIEHVIHGPVTAVDLGKITVTENWGRLFIKSGDKEIMIDRWVYPALCDAIARFIEPQPDPRDEVIALAISACRIIDDAVKEGYDTVNGLMMHLLEAVEPARAALAAAKAVQHG